MRSIFFFASMLFGATTFAQVTSGDIIGTFMTKDKTEGIPMAAVYTQRGEAFFRAMTDEDGRFRISGLPAGDYKVFFVYQGDTIPAPRPVEVVPDGFGDVGIVLNDRQFGVIEVYADQLKLSKGVAPDIKLSKKDIKFRPDKFDAKSMIASMTTDVRKTDDGSLVFRGARKGDLISYIDGVKMVDVQNVPSSALGYIMVYSGAIPAKYGDTTGGVVVMETVSYFDLLREWEARK